MLKGGVHERSIDWVELTNSFINNPPEPPGSGDSKE